MGANKMHNLSRGSYIVMCCLLLAMAPAPTRADNVTTPVANTQSEVRVVQDGLFKRDLLIFKPRDPDGQRPAIVLLSFLGGDPGSMATLTDAARLARDYGFYVLLPQSIAGIWNYNALTGLIDDIDFLDQVIDLAISDLPVDPGRIFMAGYSNGGLMTHAYACDRADRLAGAATIASSLRNGIKRNCSPSAALSFYIFHGAADPVVPYDGNGITLSSPETAAFWAHANGCAPEPMPGRFPDTVDDDTTTTTDTYSGCRDGSTVKLYTTENGGHTWPGTPQVQPALGRVGQDIDETDLLGRLFSQLPRQ